MIKGVCFPSCNLLQLVEPLGGGVLVIIISLGQVGVGLGRRYCLGALFLAALHSVGAQYMLLLMVARGGKRAHGVQTAPDSSYTG